jgi:hypothetical protein
MLAPAIHNTEMLQVTIEPQLGSVDAGAAGCEVELVESQS